MGRESQDQDSGCNCLVFRFCSCVKASQVAQVVKNPPVNAGDLGDSSSIPGSGRFPGGGPGNPLQYRFLENPVCRGAWRAPVHRLAQSWTQLNRLSKAQLC